MPALNRWDHICRKEEREAAQASPRTLTGFRLLPNTHGVCRRFKRRSLHHDCTVSPPRAVLSLQPVPAAEAGRARRAAAGGSSGAAAPSAGGRPRARPGPGARPRGGAGFFLRGRRLPVRAFLGSVGPPVGFRNGEEMGPFPSPKTEPEEDDPEP